MTTAKSRGPALRGKGRRMTGSIGRFVVRRARLVLVAAMLVVVGFGVLGFGAFGKLKTGGFHPGAQSTTAQTLTDQRFGGSVGVVLLVHAETGTVDDAPARAAGAEAASRLAAVPGVSNVVSYWQTRNPGLRSKDGKYALVLGSTKSDRDLSASELASLRSLSKQVDVTVGGSAAIGNDITTQVGKSLRTAEMIAVPIILALLVFAFGSVVAALLPALLAVLGRRVNSGRLPWARDREPSTAAPFWGRLAGQVMRRPALLAIPVLAVLMLLALPLRHVQLGTPDDRVLPGAR